MEIVPGGSFTVVVTPPAEAVDKLIVLFNAIGQWLDDGGLASCDVTFGARGMTVLPSTADNLGDPTAFLIERSRQLETALASRVVIELAKGILAERHGIGLNEAFERLRREARNGRRKLHDVAGEVVTGDAPL